MHKWYQATNCPGPYLQGRSPYVADQVNKRLSEKEESKRACKVEQKVLQKGAKGPAVKAIQTLLIGVWIFLRELRHGRQLRRRDRQGAPGLAEGGSCGGEQVEKFTGSVAGMAEEAGTSAFLVCMIRVLQRGNTQQKTPPNTQNSIFDSVFNWSY